MPDSYCFRTAPQRNRTEKETLPTTPESVARWAAHQAGWTPDTVVAVLRHLGYRDLDVPAIAQAFNLSRGGGAASLSEGMIDRLTNTREKLKLANQAKVV